MSDAARLGAFAEVYLRRPADREGRTAAELEAEVRGAFALLAGRGRAPLAVRAFTPDAQRDGYETGGSVLETTTPDLPFLVDSVTAELLVRGHRVQRVVHPIVGTRRDGAGELVEVGRPRDLPTRESVMHFELAERVTPEALAGLEDAARRVLTTVAVVVEDFPAMRERLDELAGATGSPDVARFLRWLDDGHFAYLGFRRYAVEDGAWGVVDGTGLGLLRDGQTRVPDLRGPACDGQALHVGKTDGLSPVHRRERMDDVVVALPDGSEGRLLGLLGSRAYAEPASTTPLLAQKLEHVLDAEDLVEGSHDFKAAVALFDSFPKDELFATPAEELRGVLAELLALRADAVRLLLRRAADGRSAWAIAALPRAGYGPAQRDRIRDLLVEALGSTHVTVHEVLEVDGQRARVHVGLHDPEGLPDVDAEALEAAVRVIARSWEDRLREALVAAHGEEPGRMLAARWAGRFPESYRAAVDPQVAVGDVDGLQRLQDGARDLVVGLQPAGDRTRVALYKRGAKVELARATQMLEHLGLRAIEEHPTRVGDDEEAWVQAFAVVAPDGGRVDLAACGDRVAATLDAVFHGETESDSLNRLVVLGGLDHRQVQVLRAYRRYRQRIGSRYTEGFQNDVICAHAAITEQLVRLFELRHGAHDVTAPRDEAAERALRDEVLAALDGVELLDHDRILRNQLGLIEATVRTNAYRPDRDALAFKLRSADVPAIPQPAPLFEIFVYAPDMEGVHLRGGKIARGGLRWSDRMDYRTEVFGLMRAQMTKNAVIVPAGAKGGFFLKAEGRPSFEEVRRQYVRYVEALLDVTDDVAPDGTVVPPTGVRVLDEDDTYLVVAADKGTATFSDTANGIALRRGFWLGDAFASGGSNGYDHKALGITARGAWESVKRHFRELGVDPEADVVTAVGIGDMSGDVFGNGLLLSRTVKLVAAYDHRHVFLDPDPDPARSWEERRRLFELGRQGGSSWEDYDRGLLSAGGGVFPRGAKSIRLTPEIRAVLGVEEEELPPTEVIRAILRAPVDLLFNGGIGTVVKASTESDADALDRSSDAIRVDARDLRCRVVGEGGNLGMTQRGRVEAARHGVLCHADFIDNSAGVDTSDHEVNLKVLLDLAVRRGDLDAAGRTALLQDSEADVVAHVLRNSASQARVLAQEVQGAGELLDAYDDLLVGLVEDGLLTREAERLPSAEELGERRRRGEGLVRPELAVLLASAKRSLTGELLASPLPDEPWLQDVLRGYFPGPAVARFGDLLGEHPLRRELIATVVANDVVDRLGPTFVSRLVTERGAAPSQVVRAYRIARAALGADDRWGAVAALDPVLADRGAFWALEAGVAELVGDVTRWCLAHVGDEDPLEAVRRMANGVTVLEDALDDLRDERWRAARDRTAEALAERGVPHEVALRHASQPALVHAPDVVVLAAETGRSLLDAARATFAIGDALRLEWLEGELDEVRSGGRVQRWARNAVRDDVLDARRVLAARALADAPDADPDEAVRRFLEARGPAQRRLTSFTRALDLDEGPIDLAGLTLAVRHVRALAR
jgi:glutamate dehydrogenase